MKILMALLSIILVPMMTTQETAADQSRSWLFDVFLDDKPIGQHQFVLEQQSQREWVLTSKADFAVSFLFIEVYNYQHQAIERWKGDCLQSIQARTNDFGEVTETQGQQQEDVFMLGDQELASCVMSFAYWNPAMLQQNHLLNPQTGEYEQVRITFLGHDNIQIEEQTVLADRYQLQAQDQQITLWYVDNQWISLEAILDEQYTLRYDLAAK